MNRCLSAVRYCSLFCAGILTGYCMNYLLHKKAKRTDNIDLHLGEAKFLLQRRRNSDPCKLHLLTKQSCGKECRYEFLKWVLSCIDEAKSHLDVCMYFLSDMDIADALIRAKERGVKVRVITSHVDEESGTMGEAMLKMRRVHIPFRTMKAPQSQLMHLKMIVVDHEYVLYGSMNFTKSAIESNSEEIIRLPSPSIVADCSRYIQEVWDDMTEQMDFVTRIGTLAEKRLKANAKLKAQSVSFDELGKW